MDLIEYVGEGGFNRDDTHVEKASPNVGLEPTTLRLRVWCSTDWASRDVLTFSTVNVILLHAACQFVSIPRIRDSLFINVLVVGHSL